MGWTVFSSMPKGGMICAIEEGLKPFELVFAADGGDAVYMAVKEGARVVGAVALIEGFGYKILDESMGPYYWNAPAEVLDLLSPTDNPYALKWREACRRRMEAA